MDNTSYSRKREQQRDDKIKRYDVAYRTMEERGSNNQELGMGYRRYTEKTMIIGNRGSEYKKTSNEI